MSLSQQSSNLEIDIPEAYVELYNPWRYKILWGGRGGAKSWQVAIALLAMGIRNPIRVFCGRELQKSIKDSVHKLLSDQIRRQGLQDYYEVLKGSITGKTGTTAQGTEFIFDGIKNAVSEIKSLESIDICWIEEADKVSEYSWDILIPTIRKEGSEIWATFNPSAKHAPTYKRFVLNPPPKELRGKPYCFTRKVSWRDNPWFGQVLKDEMEQLKERDYEKYLHVWEGEIQTLADGAVYGKQMLKAMEEKRVADFAIESVIEVETFWDLGKDDSTSVWFMQKVANEYRFIDYFERNQWEIADYCKMIKGTHPDISDDENKRRANYNYGDHYMPHDVNIELLGMVKNRKKQFIEGGIKPIKVVPRVTSLGTGIDLTRTMLSHCWFHKTHCEQGIDALCNYKFEWKEDDGVHKQFPLHDWSSHGADALRQCAQGYKTVKEKKEPLKRDLSWVV